MSNFTETFLASLAGIGTFYLLEGLYYDIRARIRGRQYTLLLEELEEELEHYPLETTKDPLALV